MQQLIGPTTLCVDNTSAIFKASGEGLKARSKHIDRRYHYIRQLIQSKTVVIQHISTQEMLADHLTKSLGPTGISHALQLNHMS